MQENRRVRLISKRDRTAKQSPAKPATAESQERAIKAVVSGWVSEHRLRTEEFRRTFTTILGVTAS
jgi:hypothetical protein